MSCAVGRRQGSDPELLWLLCRLAAAALIPPLAWEPPYTVGAAPKKTKKKERRRSHGLQSFKTFTFWAHIEKNGHSWSRIFPQILTFRML